MSISGTGGIPSQCKICSATFPSRTRLFAHLRADHEEEYCEHEHSQTDVHVPSSGLDVGQRQDASTAARLALSCPDLEAYYGIQSSRGGAANDNGRSGGIMTPSEWSTALSTYRTSLPLAFRINSNSFPNDSVQQLLLDALFDSVPPNAIEAVPSVPNLYVAAVPTRFWSERSRKLLGDAQEIGACHRQEVVSALPALLLGIQSHHCVLDLCAAPGSKTLQMLDLMHRQEEDCNFEADDDGSIAAMHRNHRKSCNTIANNYHDDDYSGTSRTKISYPSGILVANDPARNRLLQLTRRSRRQARTPLIASASDGRYFPTLRKVLGYKLKFDRVLCDVPCSGDGTLRKLSGGEWKKWTIREAMTLHKLQVRLLARALMAVKRGGRVLFSTCSLNPIENEAVVVEAIRQCTNITDAYRILPLPDVIDEDEERWDRCAGAVDWVVPDSKFSAGSPIVYERYDDVPSGSRKGKGVPTRSMFPPKTRRCKVVGACSCQDRSEEGASNDCLNEALADDLEATLPNAARILPQHLDSGGFFCSLIERLEATYYPVCLDPEVNARMQHAKSIHHGKIYHPVQTARQIRDMIRASPTSDGDATEADLRHVYDGVASLSAAQAWLKKHGAYVEGVSDSPCALPPMKPVPTATIVGEDCNRTEKKPKPSGKSSDGSTPMYTPIFKKPHSSLVTEFMSFYGLCCDAFPMENVVIVGGGEEADKVTSYIEVPVENESCQTINNRHDADKKRRRIKYLQLCLVSPTVRRINSGGAKFTPMECGLGLCYVPHIKDTAEAALVGSTFFVADEKTSRRSAGRYALLDEATLLVGRYATKRVVILSRYQAIKLLSSSFLCLDDSYDEEKRRKDVLVGVSGKGWSRLEDVATWQQNGGVIGVHLHKSKGGDVKQMFFSCLLCVGGEGRGLKLLSDHRLADTYRRILEI